jgi:hypothetical protein
MDLNFRQLKGLPCNPCRPSLKNTGPEEVNFITNAIIGKIGAKRTRTNRAATISAILLKYPA